MNATSVKEFVVDDHVNEFITLNYDKPISSDLIKRVGDDVQANKGDGDRMVLSVTLDKGPVPDGLRKQNANYLSSDLQAKQDNGENVWETPWMAAFLITLGIDGTLVHRKVDPLRVDVIEATEIGKKYLVTIEITF